MAEDDLPEEWSEYLEINAKYGVEWPVIDTQRDPLPTADEFREKKGKRDLLDPAAAG